LTASQAETDKQVKQVNKQIGELGNKFGSFTEGMALPSMRKIFTEQFGLEDITPYALRRRNGRTLEIDVLARNINYDPKEAYIIEVKSHLKEEGVGQILKTIAAFPQFYPEMSDHKIYGVIAAVSIADNARSAALKEGLYLAQISDDTLKLSVPPNFKPHNFNPNAGNGRKENGAKPKRKRPRK
jgi:hypothetical protein